MLIRELLNEKFIPVVLPADRYRREETTVRVYQNPSPAEYRTIRHDNVRFIVSRLTGDLWVWDAFEARHEEIFQYLYLDGDLFVDFLSGHFWPAVGNQPVEIQVDGAGRRDQGELARNRNVLRILRNFRFSQDD